MTTRGMILAAGRGERMRPLTDAVPKPLLEVAGKPLIVYQIEKLAALGVGEIVINLAWRGSMIRAALGDGHAWGVSILYSDEGDSALETGGGIFQALPLLGSEPFWVASGDVWTRWAPTAASVLAANDLAHLVMVPNPPYHPQGDFGLRAGRLEREGERLTFGNIALYRPEFFAGCSAGYFKLYPLLVRAIEAGRAGGEAYSDAWRNLGTPADLAELDAALRSGRV